ncbi:DUF5709 domain-containing protein [Spirilliplanes yamanashiensis]|uniref:DUF5709 domain-containing protein n=1 Tax=Spirilliplanes yamanashiensis TaxID=42233 RepID=A0A8J4DG03_9ACTN|nr:DUF5709 domain-containing protein [Spirilliplanes yamanashiensis]MDP9820133.1 hypothetical protein [Spirilliplanes yamanashiensis]GIJ01047.1 hypothetical protein Sya03_03990 [Spirilliplanes yamanashiensis]
MRNDQYPTPPSDPEAEGLPGTADDDSTANDGADTGRWADGPDPAALPSDEPLGVDHFGTTAEEQRTGESLNARLWQEQPDVQPETDLDDPGPLADEAIDEAGARQARLDADVYGESPTSDPNSAISMYDDGQLDDASAPVGRLVDPDQGIGPDDEPDSVAYDAGTSGGGASAEELAIHETQEPGYR